MCFDNAAFFKLIIIFLLNYNVTDLLIGPLLIPVLGIVMFQLSCINPNTSCYAPTHPIVSLCGVTMFIPLVIALTASYSQRDPLGSEVLIFVAWALGPTQGQYSVVVAIFGAFGQPLE